MSQNTILLVEDDFLNRRVTKKVLLENGYNVHESKNALEAISILKKNAVDLIIIDINLGETEQSGICLAQNIKEQFNTPFVYLTAYDTDEIVKKAVATTPRSYITKPFKNVDLITTIELAIRQSINQEKKKPCIQVKDGEYNIDLPISEIYYIESDGNYILFHTSLHIYKNRSTIKQIIQELPPADFVQIHRAYVVNKSKIKKYNSKAVFVKNIELSISKNFIDNLININATKTDE